MAVPESLIPPFNYHLMTTGKTLALKTVGEYTFGCGSDFKIRWWNWKTAKPKKTFAGHTGPVTTIAVDEVNKVFYSGSWDSTIIKWNYNAAPGAPKKLLTVKASEGFVKTLVLSADGRFLFSGDGKGILKKWDAETLRAEATALAHKNAINALTVDDSGLLYSSSSDSTLQLFSPHTLERIGGLSGIHQATVWHCRVWRDVFVTASADKFLRAFRLDPSHDASADEGIWNSDLCTMLWEVNFSDWIFFISEVRTRPDGSHAVFVACRDGKVVDVSLADGALRRTIVPGVGHCTVCETTQMLDTSLEEPEPIPVLITAGTEMVIRRWKLDDAAPPPPPPAEGSGDSSLDSDDLMEDEELDRIQNERFRAMLESGRHPGARE
eukprot:gnl/Chilomastix_cuspidata/1404.p1 GENE.gnl/Chilomastix_cuspidata/1404~~gnl/Chilomastix_cuspidata/1404.p1  ORF type:complete len:380 (+),score=144.73 gnl/Chilomastix_cuspidata/1404:825-1964(+)